ncbi:hypothetical protein TNIN_154111 [Trichonephila inaurata madagascariensis]|uniref:Uncharacterized protein n=1 Tax=Trichonephila inaurata madagascariensis TaxID=2747483 RepID=A0A8X7C9H4_9ARAC|nr:hypothetical protein TNIN_154111 [Trichonephila inaurata madagascariensis]
MPKGESFRISQACYRHWPYQIIHSHVSTSENYNSKSPALTQQKMEYNSICPAARSDSQHLFILELFSGVVIPFSAAHPSRGVKTIPMLMEHYHPSDAPLSQTIIVSPSLSLDDPVRDGPYVIVWKWITLWSVCIFRGRQSFVVTMDAFLSVWFSGGFPSELD